MRTLSADRIAGIGLVLGLLAAAHLAWTQKVNWDEFFYLSQVWDYERGTLSLALQTIHVHLFHWLTGTELDEIGQIRLGRLVMLACQAGTVLLIVTGLRAFFDRGPALFAALTYLALDNVLYHGAAFRVDPLSTFLIMGALVILLRAPLVPLSVLTFAVAAAVATLVTVKVVFYFPAFLGAALWRIGGSPRRGRDAVVIGTMAALTLGVFAALYLWHQSTLAEAEIAGSTAMLGRAASTTMIPHTLFPRALYVVQQVLWAPLESLVLVLGLVLLLIRGRTLAGSPRAVWSLVLLSLPLAVFAFYRNAFPYYFPSILPPAMGLAALTGVLIWRHARAAQIATAALVLSLGLTWHQRLPHSLAPQAKVIAAAHEIFTTPVGYIDRSGTLASFPKTGFFMSSWGMGRYQREGVPVLRDGMSREVVPLLLLNSPHLRAAVGTGLSEVLSGLLAEDIDAVSDSYVPHWGPIWVAGRDFAPAPVAVEWHVRVPGKYTVEAPKAVEINGIPHAPDSVVTLARGMTAVRADAGAVLRWGDHLARPQTAAPDGPFFTDF